MKKKIATALFVFSVSVFGFAQSSRPALLPQPREFQGREDISLAQGVFISVPGRDKDDAFAARDLADGLKELGVSVAARAGAAHVYLLRDTSVAGKRVLSEAKQSFDQPMLDEGYVLVASKRSVYVIGHTAAGVFYGAQTVKQLVSGTGGDAVLHGCVIRDWPAMKYRGV
ncbi:MAG TPA: glycoside hydrolase family 20 zincin-like fold domain-containing protein, partial [Pseudacidobacterium sp.]|nr:glycoside hydrolase family 20 zincin-like fold domain-containing protein [Pseudacidobacterium sp.]